jgi:hypothetical protein
VEENMTRLCIAVALLIVPAPLAAQEIFTPLDVGLQLGDKVHVLVDGPCATQGCSAAVVKGRIADLSAASIVLSDGRERWQLAAADVRYVERSPDRLWNGALVGFGVGFGVGFVAAISDCNSGCLFDGPAFATAVGLIFGGVGAGVGTITDALIARPRIVFVRPATRARATTVTPMVGTNGGGIRVSVSF